MKMKAGDIPFKSDERVAVRSSETIVAIPNSSSEGIRTDVAYGSSSNVHISRPGASHIRGPGQDLSTGCSNSDQLETSTVDRPASIPGAFHVRGFDEDSDDDSSNYSTSAIRTTSENEENLPVALPIIQDNEGGLPDDSSLYDYDDDYSVIDGVVVKRRRSVDILMIMITIIPIVVALSLTKSLWSIISPSKPEPPLQTLSPTPEATPSPTISMAPTYSDLPYIKSLISHITDEAILNDRNSVQHFVMIETAKNLPRLTQLGLLKRNETNKIIERYVFGVVLLSRIKNLNFFRKSIEDADVGELCDIYQCNEKGEISIFEVRNQWSTGLGEGVIADEIGFLPSLEHIIMTGNALAGTIPSSIGMLKKLKTLDLNENLLTGTIPSELGQMQSLEHVYLNVNKISGALPSEIGNMTNLHCMDLSTNNLQGTVSSELQNLINLEGLSLQSSGLNGDINFLCDKTYTNGSYTVEIDVGNTKFHEMICNRGIVVNCMESKLKCDCCGCK